MFDNLISLELHGVLLDLSKIVEKVFAVILYKHKNSAINSYVKNVLFRKSVESWFYVTFNIIISGIFPENFIEITQLVQKI